MMPSEQRPTSYRVRAFNTAAASENKIHDDTVARRFGFSGGLVPGVEVYAYMTHMAIERWGRAWLEQGTADCRFLAPVYDGKTVAVSATADGDKLSIRVESDKTTCATGTAALNGAASSAPELGGVPPPPPAVRPPADERSLAVGIRLGIAPFTVG